MRLYAAIKNSNFLRSPALLVAHTLFALLRVGPAWARRAAYDGMSVPFLVAGTNEYFVVSTKDKVIGRGIFLNGEFDFNKLELAFSVLREVSGSRPKHLIDVGANIGSIVIPALVRGYVDSAVAFEPHPENFRLLNANIALNDLIPRVTVIRAAVGSAGGELLLEESETNSGNHTIGKGGIPVAAVKLDDQALPVADSLLWMDIEGYEGHALEGAGQLLVEGIPVVCEYNPTFLRKAEGLEMLHESLGGRILFDLGRGGVRITLAELAERYSAPGDYTDILAIASSRGLV